MHGCLAHLHVGRSRLIRAHSITQLAARVEANRAFPSYFPRNLHIEQCEMRPWSK
jgi:hypothetical protein